MNKFDHILPACKQSTDGAMFFFSFIDRCVPLSVLLICTCVLHSTICSLYREILEGLNSRLDLKLRPHTPQS